MRIPGADQAIGNLIKWSEKDEWAPYRQQVFAEHFEVILERFAASEREIVDLLDEVFGMVCGFVLEDFFTARFGEKGELNVVVDYLKRRGWREKVPAKRLPGGAQGFRRDALRGRRPRSGAQHDGAGPDPWWRSRIRRGKARLAIGGALGPNRRASRHRQREAVFHRCLASVSPPCGGQRSLCC
jgi:hypothetical protein